MKKLLFKRIYCNLILVLQYQILLAIRANWCNYGQNRLRYSQAMIWGILLKSSFRLHLFKLIVRQGSCFHNLVEGILEIWLLTTMKHYVKRMPINSQSLLVLLVKRRKRSVMWLSKSGVLCVKLACYLLSEIRMWTQPVESTLFGSAASIIYQLFKKIFITYSF